MPMLCGMNMCRARQTSLYSSLAPTLIRSSCVVVVHVHFRLPHIMINKFPCLADFFSPRYSIVIHQLLADHGV